MFVYAMASEFLDEYIKESGGIDEIKKFVFKFCFVYFFYMLCYDKCIPLEGL